MSTSIRNPLSKPWLRYKKSYSSVQGEDTQEVDNDTRPDFTPSQERKLFELHAKLGPFWNGIAISLYEPATDSKSKFAPRYVIRPLIEHFALKKLSSELACRKQWEKITELKPGEARINNPLKRRKQREQLERAFEYYQEQQALKRNVPELPSLSKSSIDSNLNVSIGAAGENTLSSTSTKVRNDASIETPPLPELPSDPVASPSQADTTRPTTIGKDTDPVIDKLDNAEPKAREAELEMIPVEHEAIDVQELPKILASPKLDAKILPEAPEVPPNPIEKEEAGTEPTAVALPPSPLLAPVPPTPSPASEALAIIPRPTSPTKIPSPTTTTVPIPLEKSLTSVPTSDYQEHASAHHSALNRTKTTGAKTRWSILGAGSLKARFSVRRSSRFPEGGKGDSDVGSGSDVEGGKENGKKAEKKKPSPLAGRVGEKPEASPLGVTKEVERGHRNVTTARRRSPPVAHVLTKQTVVDQKKPEAVSKPAVATKGAVKETPEAKNTTAMVPSGLITNKDELVDEYLLW